MEGSGDRDGDGIPDYLDFDPGGYLYDEATGRIVPGGHVTITGPGPVMLLDDGSQGFYRFTATVPGIYAIIIDPPSQYFPSKICLRQDPPPLDPTGSPDPLSLGNGQAGTTGMLTSHACTPFYLSVDLAAGDPFVINNNVPLRFVPIPTPVLSEGALVLLALILFLIAAVTIGATQGGDNAFAPGHPRR